MKVVKHSKGVEALKEEAKSRHHLMTHQPKNPYCDICQRAKMYKPPSYATGGFNTVEAKEFGDHVTADHIVIYREKDVALEDSRLALVIKDVATHFTYAYPSALKSTEECVSALQHFTSAKDNIKVFYSDRAKVSVRRPCRGEGEAGGQVEMLPVEGFLQWICCRARPCWACLMLMYADVSGRARGAARGQRVTHPSSTAEDDCGRRHGLSRDATRTLRLRRWNDLVGEGSGTRVGDVEADMTRKDMLSCGFCGAAQSH